MTKPFERPMSSSIPKSLEFTSSSGSAKFKMFLIFVIVFCFGYFGGNLYDFNHLKELFNKLTSQNTPVKKTVVNKKEPNYEFYTMLQNEINHPTQTASNNNKNNLSHKPVANNKKEVNKVVATSSVNKNNTNKVSAGSKKSSYLVQAASFKYREEAQRMKASLILKGFPANVIVITRDQTNWYRVMIGPYVSKEQAQKVNVAIARSEHITGMVRKMDA